MLAFLLSIFIKFLLKDITNTDDISNINSLEKYLDKYFRKKTNINVTRFQAGHGGFKFGTQCLQVSLILAKSKDVYSNKIRKYKCIEIYSVCNI